MKRTIAPELEEGSQTSRALVAHSQGTTTLACGASVTRKWAEWDSCPPTAVERALNIVLEQTRDTWEGSVGTQGWLEAGELVP